MESLTVQYANSTLSDRIAKIVVMLMALGTVFVFSAGTSLGQDFTWQQFYRFPGARQLFYFPLAVLVMFLFSHFNHHWLSFSRGFWKSLTPYGLGLSIALLILVLIMGIDKGGARRWLLIPLGPVDVSFQPSELAKWMTLFFIAAICAYPTFELKSFFKGFIPVCAVIAIVVGLILKEDFGTAAFIALLSFILLILGGAKWWHILSPLPLGALLFMGAIIYYPHRVDRLKAFLNPEKYADTVAYQANQSLIALGSGGVIGKGLGKGICKYRGLPEDTTDFVFSIIGEELGLVGTLAVILLFLSFLWVGFRVTLKAQDAFSRLLAAGITLGIAIQAALNIGVVTVVLPTKGIPLPFVSGGGTSLLVSAAAIGILLNIAREVESSERIDGSQD